MSTIHELIAAQVRRTPDAAAVVDGTADGATVTYADLDAWAGRIARRLAAHGVGPDTPVGLVLDRSVALVAGLLGILQAGGAYLPMEPEMPPARLQRLLRDAGAPVCLVRPDLAPVVADSGCTPMTVARDEPCRTPASPPAVAAQPDSLVAIYYTSGSTGQPKGVACTHAGWVNRLRWMQRCFDLRAGETVLQKTTITFDDAAVEVFWPLMVGGRIGILAPGAHRDPRAIIDAAIRLGAVHLQFVPSVLELFLDALTPADLAGLDRLRSVLSAGDALRPELVAHFRELFAERVSLSNLWGATEVSIDSTHHTCGADDTVPATTPVTLGAPLHGNRVYVLDDRLEPVPDGIAGELCIAGVGLARGYCNDPRRTAAAFVPDPTGMGERMYRTGDRGWRRPDGSFVFQARRDNQVKIRGMRLELGEVAAALREHPQVCEATVVVTEPVPGDKRLAAYAAVPPDRPVGAAELREYLRGMLPDHAIPASITLLDRLPRGSNGKLDRAALPAPEPDGPPYVAPRTLTEEVLAEIWQELLGLDRIGVHEDFFEVGGHSLLAMRLLSRVRHAFATDVPLRLAFDFPTIAQAAERIEQLLMSEIDEEQDGEPADHTPVGAAAN